jgi:uncharacterized protein
MGVSTSVTWRLALVLAVGMGGAMSAQGPAFDCSKAQGEVETLICKDADLAKLDRTLDEVYKASVKKAGGGAPARLRAEQRGFISGRNECWKARGAPMSLTATWQATTVQECVSGTYKLRISDLQAYWQLVPAKAPVTYTCGAPANQLSATFYETDPATVRVTRGGKTQTLWQVRSASGARYEGQNVEFWSKGNEATVTWLDEKLQCAVR